MAQEATRVPSCNSSFFLVLFGIDQRRRVDDNDGGTMKSTANDLQIRMKI